MVEKSIAAIPSCNFAYRQVSKRQRNNENECFTCLTSFVGMAQKYTIMKTNFILSAIAALALLIPGNAAARDNRHHGNMGKHRTEMRLAHNRPAPHMRHMKHVAHRPSMGARFNHRPVHGRFITMNRERLWLADGVLYRQVRTPHRTVYVVVGYWR